MILGNSRVLVATNCCCYEFRNGYCLWVKHSHWHHLILGEARKHGKPLNIIHCPIAVARYHPTELFSGSLTWQWKIIHLWMVSQGFPIVSNGDSLPGEHLRVTSFMLCNINDSCSASWEWTWNGPPDWASGNLDKELVVLAELADFWKLLVHETLKHGASMYFAVSGGYWLLVVADGIGTSELVSYHRITIE